MTPNVAVIGCGYWGRHLVRNFAELGALGGICDPALDRAGVLSARFGAPVRAYTEILADSSIAGVIIAAPAEKHFPLAREALAAGKHVYVEKPLALDLGEAAALCRQAAEAQRVLMVGHLLQYHPAFLALREMSATGKLGRLHYIYSNRLNLGKVRREENALWSFAPHDISMILALVGEEPEEVSAMGASYLHKIIADVTITHLSFRGGERAHIFVSWLHPFKEQKLVTVGSQGMAVFDDGQPWESKLLFYPHRIDWIDGLPQPSKADAVPVPVVAEEPLRLECRHFLECIAGRLTPRTDGAEGLRVLKVLDAAERSMATGVPVPLTEARLAGTPAVALRQGVEVHESAHVEESVEIGAGTKIWHFSHLLPRTRIGRDCVIGQNVVIGPDVVVGNRCKIQNNVSLYKGVTLEDGVFCGPSCVFTNVNTPRAEIERKSEFRPTLVKHGATIGANATIVCGHTLGEYCLIAAGAVVTSDVPQHALMAGVPARRIGWVSHAGERLGSDLVCPREGRHYREAGPDRLEEIA
ncbi:MAG: 2 3 4 5-tetrahydropyridine-2 6-dicarboxylate N-acetyltransferase [Rhodospirillaceae bacterium]|nr:MAG: 2 3 4 5-tetrahydropyridine-2 6-dicarboxylate N-acetyltransferase [Rhodospirillaceae bacterium]